MPPHDAAHGFSAGRSIVTNAPPHVKQAVLVKFDLANFYPSVTFARVTAIFRSLGYSREAAIWLARLTTSALPANIPFVKQEPSAVLPYLRRHLPQGAADVSGAGQPVGLFARRAAVGLGARLRRRLHPLCRRPDVLRTVAVRHVAPRLHSARLADRPAGAVPRERCKAESPAHPAASWSSRASWSTKNSTCRGASLTA